MQHNDYISEVQYSVCLETVLQELFNYWHGIHRTFIRQFCVKQICFKKYKDYLGYRQNKQLRFLHSQEYC